MSRQMQSHQQDRKYSGWLRYFLPGLGEVIFAAVFIAVLGLGPRLFNVDGDLGRHLTIGQYILDELSIPTRDIFSHTLSGEALTPHEWLAQVLFAAVHGLEGFDGLVWLAALILGGTFWLIYREAFERSGQILTAAGFTCLAAAASSLHWLIRPHLVTIDFTAIWVRQCEKIRAGKKRSWIWLPGLMLLWVNLHGAFLVGIMIWMMYFLGAFLSGERVRTAGLRWGLSGLTTLLVTGINPVGWEIYSTGFGFLGNRYLVGHTAEYLPPDFHHPSTWPFLLLIAGSLFLLGLTRIRLHPSHAVLLAGWTAMGLYSTRNIPLYAVIAAPILTEAGAEGLNSLQNKPAGWFRKLQDRLSQIQDHLNPGIWGALLMIFTAMILLMGYNLGPGAAPNRYQADKFPVQAADWLEEHPQEGNPFNYFPWGGYLLYRGWPDMRVFIDGQTDFYGEELTREYEQVLTQSGEWLAVLERYQVRWVIMPKGLGVVEELLGRESWTLIYQDQTTEIAARNSGH